MRWLLLGASLAVLGLAISRISGVDILNAYAARGDLREEKALPYGPLPRQHYDLYTAEDDAGPVLVFFHGGSWQFGDPSLYPFLGRRLAREGFTTAIPAYRLSPETVFPGFVADAAKAVAAIRARFGPDRPVFVLGHSAGAHIAVLLALDPRYLSAEGLDPCRDIAGVIGLAGPYDFLPLKDEALKIAFPEATRPESQPIAHAEGRHPPALLIHGAADDVVEAADSRILAEALQASGNRVTLRIYPTANHNDVIAAISPLAEPLAPVMADLTGFIAEVSAAGYPGCR